MPGDQGSIGELEMRKELLTGNLISKIKEDIGTCWYDLGIELGFESARLTNLEQDYRKVKERANQVLEIWRGGNGREATVGRLAWALIKIGHRSIADKLLAISKSTQPSEQEDEQSKFPSEQGSKQSKQQSERKGEQIKQPNEPEAPDEIFSLLAEVQQMRKKVSGLESQPKEYSGEQAKQPTGCVGGQSKQQCEQETADDMFSLLADIQKLTKTVIEHKRQRTEDETLKKMIEDIKQMNLQVQQLIKKNNSERKL